MNRHFTVGTVVTEEDYRRLNQLARGGKQSLSSLIRGLLNDGLEAEGEALLQELGGTSRTTSRQERRAC
jgi:hypothetical protein